MKSAIYQGKGRIDLVERPTPQAGDDGVLLRNLHAGVCGTDAAAYRHGPESYHMDLGCEFGHEVVSEVAFVGKNVTGLQVGQRVYPYPLLATGDPRRAGMLGGFSEFILVPVCEVGVHVYPVPDEVSSVAASMIEPFTVAMNAARRAQPKPGQTAVVWGAGTIGIGTAIALRHFGCEQVLIADLSDFRLQKAAQLGFPTINVGTQDLIATTREMFGDAPSLRGPVGDVDIYVDAAAADSLIGEFQRVGKMGSRLVVVAVHGTPVPVAFDQLAFAQHSLDGAGGYTPEDVREVIALLASGRYPVEQLVTHEFGLDDIVEAVETASDTRHALHVSITY